MWICCSLPVRNHAEKHTSTHNTQHDKGLRQAGQKEGFADQIPFRYDRRLENTRIELTLIALVVATVGCISRYAIISGWGSQKDMGQSVPAGTEFTKEDQHAKEKLIAAKVSYLRNDRIPSLRNRSSHFANITLWP